MTVPGQLTLPEPSLDAFVDALTTRLNDRPTTKVGHYRRRLTPLHEYLTGPDTEWSERKAIAAGLAKRDPNGELWITTRCNGCDGDLWLPCPDGLSVMAVRFASMMACEGCAG